MIKILKFSAIALFLLLIQLLAFDLFSLFWLIFPSLINLVITAYIFLKINAKAGRVIAVTSAIFISVVIAFNVQLVSTLKFISGTQGPPDSLSNKKKIEILSGSSIGIVGDTKDIYFHTQRLEWPRYKSDFGPSLRFHGSSNNGYRRTRVARENLTQQLDLLKFKIEDPNIADYVLDVRHSVGGDANRIEFSLYRKGRILTMGIEERKRTTLEEIQKTKPKNTPQISVEYLFSGTFWHQMVRAKYDKPSGSPVRSFINNSVEFVKPPIVIMGTEPLKLAYSLDDSNSLLETDVN